MKGNHMDIIRRLTENAYGNSPFEQLADLRNQINRFFEPATGMRRTAEFFNGWVPALDLFEDTDNLVVRAEMPGMKRDQIDICLHDGALTISGERANEEPPDQGQVYRSERSYGRFHRVLSLPKPVDLEKVQAIYQEGILTITLPKAVEAKPRQVRIVQG
jgi:HSP20 family protein